MRLEHDPESGCGQCPMLRLEAGSEGCDDAADNWAPYHTCAAREYGGELVWYGKAPEDCPLRDGPVTVADPVRPTSAPHARRGDKRYSTGSGVDAGSVSAAESAASSSM